MSNAIKEMEQIYDMLWNEGKMALNTQISLPVPYVSNGVVGNQYFTYKEVVYKNKHTVYPPELKITVVSKNIKIEQYSSNIPTLEYSFDIDREEYQKKLEAFFAVYEKIESTLFLNPNQFLLCSSTLYSEYIQLFNKLIPQPVQLLYYEIFNDYFKNAKGF